MKKAEVDKLLNTLAALLTDAAGGEIRVCKLHIDRINDGTVERIPDKLTKSILYKRVFPPCE